jgi:hypothetical protein
MIKSLKLHIYLLIKHHGTSINTSTQLGVILSVVLFKSHHPSFMVPVHVVMLLGELDPFLGSEPFSWGSEPF